MDATAAELRSAPDAVDVVTAVVDLGQPAERLLDAVRRAVGDLEIGLLVANAAWSPVGPFLDSDLAALLAAIDINCRAPVVLVHELGARMAARGRGGIIVMSSLAAETGAANVALYSATKAFDLVLAEGLWYELRDRGVDVVAIRPGSTRTPGWQSTQPRERRPRRRHGTGRRRARRARRARDDAVDRRRRRQPRRRGDVPQHDPSRSDRAHERDHRTDLHSPDTSPRRLIAACGRSGTALRQADRGPGELADDFVDMRARLLVEHEADRRARSLPVDPT